MAQQRSHLVTPQTPLRPAGGWSAELDCALRAARAGCAAVLRHYGTTESITKAGGTPVTAADHDSAAAIIDIIRASFPDDAILCEETADTPARLGANRVWIVDPLDGTKEFVAQNGEFSVMIGFVQNGEPVVGAVAAPAIGHTWFAARGAGSWVQDYAGVRTLLRAAHVPDRLLIVTSRSHADAAVEAMCAALPITGRRPSGSVGLKCALIAQGECDVYAHPVPYMGEWDTCAPEVILHEAGGSVTDCYGRPLRYNKPEPRQPDGILACAPGCIDSVLAVIAGTMGASTA